MKPYNERLPLIDAAIDELKTYPHSSLDYLFSVSYGYGCKVKAFCHSRDMFISTRDEFNQRKAERQNKPSWADAPEWAKWLCQSHKGDWMWFSVKPNIEGNVWCASASVDGLGFVIDFTKGLAMQTLEGGEVIGNWQDTLEKRPVGKIKSVTQNHDGSFTADEKLERGDMVSVGFYCENQTAPEVKFDMKAPSGVHKEQRIKYEYGVEYETNGEKPDLPDDVLVLVKTLSSRDKWASEAPIKFCQWLWAGESESNHIHTFMIADERYKPKDESNSQEQLDSSGSQPEVDNWNGERPPIGAKVDYENALVEVVAHDQKLPQVCVRHSDGQLSVLAIAWLKPHRTETDELVEQMTDELRGCELSLTGDQLKIICNHMAEQGYRKIKPMSEDEFAEKARTMTDVELYLAGCRFLDQGE